MADLPETTVRRLKLERASRLLAVLIVGGIAVALLAPGPGVAARPSDGQSDAMAEPDRREATAISPSPTQVGGHSVDAILVYVNESGSPWYSFRGHSPAVPMPVGAPLSWAWFSGDPAAPDLAAPAAPLDAVGGAKQARVAFSREGYAVAVWDSESVYDSRTCPAGETNVTKADIKFSVFQDATGTWTAPAIAAAAPLPTEPEKPFHEAFTGPVIAIDSNGHGILLYSYLRSDPCDPAATTREIRYSMWTGPSSSPFGPSTVLRYSTAPPHLTFDPLAFAFSSHLADADATTRQHGIAIWWEAVEPATKECVLGPTSVPRFWPQYARWNGSEFGPIDIVPGQRSPSPGSDRFESLEVRRGMAASPDQLGHVAVGFPVSTKMDPCLPGDSSKEVWRAIWNATTEMWENGTKVDDGGNPAVAYGTDLPRDRARIVYEGLDLLPGVIDPTINGSVLDGIAIGNLGQISPTETGRSPAIAHLPHDTALMVWAYGTGDLQFWQRVGGPSPAESTGTVGAAGGSPFLGARTGSPLIPHAEWTYLHYMAHDDIPAPMTAEVLDRLQSAGSTSLVNLAILLDDGGNPSQANDYYVKRLARTPLQNHAGGLNLAAQATLEQFIARTVERYPARGEYALALEGHGIGWRGVCSDDRPVIGDRIGPAELRGALASVNVPIEIAVVNACLMGNIETAYQLQEFVRLMIASQEATPISTGSQGMPYDSFLGRLIQDPIGIATDPLAARAFARLVVADYEEANAGLRDYAIASIRVREIPALVGAIAAFTNLVIPLIDPADPDFNRTVLDALRMDRDSAQRIRSDSGVRDLFHFFSLVQNDGMLPPEVHNATLGVLERELLVVDAEWSEPLTKPNARGLNVWFEPSRVQYNDAAGSYGVTRFAANTSWQDVVRHLAQPATRGVRVVLQSPNPDLFLRVRDEDGSEVGTYSPSETCGGFCNSQIPAASCSKSGGSTTIFLPLWATPIDWFVDGTLLGASAPYSLTIQEVSTDSATGDTIVLFSEDRSGNVTPGQVIEDRFVPDAVQPTTTHSVLGVAGRAPWWRSDVMVTLVVNESGHGIASTWYSLDGSPDLRYTEPFQVAGDGNHTLEYFSIDLVGNQGAKRSSVIRIDKTAPTVTATVECVDPEAPDWCLGTAFVTLHPSDATSGIAATEVRLDEGNFASYAGPLPVAGDGTHQVGYQAIDNAGNLAVEATRAVQIDATRPRVQADLDGIGGNDDWFRSAVTFRSISVDETSGVHAQTIRIGSGLAVPYVDAVVIDMDGDFPVELVVVDVAGNRANLTVPLKIDRTPPAFSLILPTLPGRPVTTSSLTVTVRDVLDPTSGVTGCWLAVDGGTPVALGPTGSHEFTGLGDGAHLVTATCTDAAGNTATKADSFAVNVNPLSTEGPYGPWPFASLVGAFLAIAAGVGMLVARRRKRTLYALSRRWRARQRQMRARQRQRQKPRRKRGF